MADSKHDFELPDMTDVPPVDFAFDEPSPLDDFPQPPDADDEFFKALFAEEFGRTLVSDDLKASIVSQVEAASSKPSHLKVVEGGKPRPRRTPQFKLRVSRFAAAAALVLVAVSGGLTLRMPTAFVSVSGPESTIQLGINVFGMTVSATSQDAAGQEMLSGVDVNNMGYEDSLRLIAGMIGGGDPANMNVEVSSVTGLQKSSLEDSASKVLDQLLPRVAVTEQTKTDATPKVETPSTPSVPVQAVVVNDVPRIAEATVPETPQVAAPVSEQVVVPVLAAELHEGNDEPSTPAEPETPETPEIPDGPLEDIASDTGETVETIASNDLESIETIDAGSPAGQASAEVSSVPVTPVVSLEENNGAVVPQMISNLY